MRSLIQFAYGLRRKVLGALKVRTHGVKVVARNPAGEVLLVRNLYGSTHLFVLPAVGRKRRESPFATAARELNEETGCVLEAPTVLGDYQSTAEGKRDTVTVIVGRAIGEPRPDGVETAEAAFFALDALPDSTSPATRRRLQEVAGRSAPAKAW